MCSMLGVGSSCSGPSRAVSGEPSGGSSADEGDGEPMGSIAEAGLSGDGSGSSGGRVANGAADMPGADASSDVDRNGAPPEDGGDAHGEGAAVSIATLSDALAGEAAASSRTDGEGAALLVYPAFAVDATIDGGLAQLNAYRTLAGLPSVVLDPVSSLGCAAHLQYLICAAAAGGGNGYLEHTETGYPACATVSGAQAGIESDLAWGESSSIREIVGQSLGQAVDDWMNGLYHRTPLLDPGLTKVGAASIEGYNCLDYGGAGNTVSARAASPVLFPPNGATDVPDNFVGNEDPCPTAPSDPLTSMSCAGSGFIVTANWYGWGTVDSPAITAVSSVSMTDAETSAAVPLLTFYADTVSGHDPAPGYVHNEIALVPEANLAANHMFTVTLDATISGQASTVVWSFTTGARVQTY
jgi:hypothetical protein